VVFENPENPESKPHADETDPDSSGIAQDSPQGGGEGAIGGQGGEGEGAENLSPDIEQEGVPGQTETDAGGDEARDS
jgi:hypothetical protein